MIVKNEEKFLAEALAQAASHCDEMVVADTGSTDGTVAIANAAGARVFHFEWRDDFAAARNFSIGKASGEWILVLDADERVTPEDWFKIREAASSADSGDCFDLDQVNYTVNPSTVGFQANENPVPGFEGYPGFTISRLTRLFRNDVGLRFEGVVHEHLCHEGRIVDGADLCVRLHHHGQALPPADMRAKKAFYRELGREKARRFPRDFKARHELGIAHWEAGDLDAAHGEFSVARDLNPADAKNLIALATVLQLRGDLHGAEALFRDLIAMRPDEHSACAALGCCLRKQGRLNEAIDAFKRQVEIDPDFPQARAWLAEAYAERRFRDFEAKATLSVCYIVKNEADCLGRSLDNVRPHCDEIIVADTGSSDATVEIARSRGAKVFVTPWNDNFAAARNASLKRATSEWILVLDADEILGEKDWTALKDLMRHAAVPMHFLVQTTYTDAATSLNWKPNDIRQSEAAGYKGYFESPLVRFFRNTPRIRFHGAVHEHARHDDASVRSAMTTIRIHHYGKYRVPERMREKYELYHRIGVRKAEEMPQSAQAHYELAVQRMELSLDEGVEDGLKKALELEPGNAEALIALANFYLQKKRLAESLKCFMRLIAAKPSDPQSYVYTASLLIEVKKYELAMRMLETARELGGEDNVALLMNEGVIHLQSKDFTAAEERFRKALTFNPEFAPVLVNLGITLTRLGVTAEAERYLRRAAELAPRDVSARQRLGELLFQAGRREESLKAFLQAHELVPADPDIISQIVLNAHALGESALVFDFETKLAAAAHDATGRSALERVEAFYAKRGDVASSARLAAAVADARRGGFLGQ